MKPYRCPVCHGKGKVSPDFYPDHKGTEWANCRACNGSGLVWGTERQTYIPYYPYPYTYPTTRWTTYKYVGEYVDDIKVETSGTPKYIERS